MALSKQRMPEHLFLTLNVPGLISRQLSQYISVGNIFISWEEQHSAGQGEHLRGQGEGALTDMEETTHPPP